MIELNFTDWNFVLTVITALGVIVAVVSLIFQTRGEKKAEELTAFAEYTKRYQEIMLNLPEELNNFSTDITTQQRRYLWAYLDLCSEQNFLHNEGYINQSVWSEWESGIKWALSQIVIKEYWQSRMDNSSYRDFKLLAEKLLAEIENEKEQNTLNGERGNDSHFVISPIEELSGRIDVGKIRSIIKKTSDIQTDKRINLQQVSEIVNKHIAYFTKMDISIITTSDDFQITTNLIYNHKFIFDKIFSIKAPIQKTIKKSFFHYKSFDLVFQWINEGYITAAALANYNNKKNGDDIKEYEHFFDITLKDAVDKDSIKKKKDELFILCLTENCIDERFWREYAKNDNGVCLELEIIDKKNNDLSDKYNLNKVCYDDGNDFQFMSNMQDELFLSFGRYILPNNHAKFAALYKRKEQFEWEKETRLLIDYGYYVESLKDIFTLYPIEDKKYLKIPFDNPLFSIKLKSISFGKNLDPVKIKELEDLLCKKGIRQQERLCITM